MSDNETLPEIEIDLRCDKRRFSNSDATAIGSRIEKARKRQEESHKREVEALKQRLKELDAEVAAKDEVIKTLDAEVRKYQEERELRIAAQKAKAAAEGYADGKRDATSNNATVPSVPEVPSNEDKLRECIKDLHRQLESMTLQRDQTFELFRRTVAKDYAEWRVVVKVKGRWLVSPHVFPGMTRRAAWDIAKSDRERYEDARPQIRICSDWSDADVCPIEEGETDGSK